MCEEAALLELPVIYDIIACSQTVRVYKISIADFKSKVPIDVLSKLEANLWPRLNYLRDRLLNLHQMRN